MTHLLLISHDEEVPYSLKEVFTAKDLRTIIRAQAQDSLETIERGVFDCAIIYAPTTPQSLLTQVTQLRQANKDLFIIAISSKYNEQTEANALTNGADLYFAEPIPAQTLKRLIQQQRHNSTHNTLNPLPTPPKTPTSSTNAQTSFALKTLRDFSNILTYSLDSKALTQQFIFKLREHIRFSRIGIFLEDPAKQSLVKGSPPTHLTCITALGLPNDLMECFQLSRDAGIGKTLTSHPRVLDQRQLDFNSENDFIRKEFDILGCHLALPISDRERTLGVAVLNGPVTDRDFSQEELELLYLLLEELGVAIQNSRLHDDLANHGQLIDNVLRSMSSGAIAISEHLEILYANSSAHHFLNLPEHTHTPMQWADLPNQIAIPVHRAVTLHETPAPFKITSPQNQNVYRISIIPLSQQSQTAPVPRPVMLMIEDFTLIEFNKAAELQTSRDELISLIAERFAHEIRNSLVPLTTHAQLLDRKINNPTFQTSLKNALLNETNRIKRFSEQMLFIAQDTNTTNTPFNPIQIIHDAYQRAQTQLKRTNIPLNLLNQLDSTELQGDIETLGYALEELFLNALQASPNDSDVTLRLHNPQPETLSIQLRDSGPGFSTETIRQATEPFYTTRNTGIGLGLSIAKKIISNHNGNLTILDRNKHSWDIEIQLPTVQALPVHEN